MYSEDDVTSSSVPSSSSSWSEVDDGCGRRKKYVTGMMSGRTYVTLAVREVQ